MSKRLAPLIAATLCIGLGGCGFYNRSIQSAQLAQAPELPRNQVDKVDGIYKGLVYPIMATGPGCPPAQGGTIEIGDRSLFFAYTPGTVFITFVQPDGTLEGKAGDVTLHGQLADGRLRFTVKAPQCETRYSFRYII